MISGEPADAGSILEVENSAAVTLIGLGKAIEHQQEAVACPAKPPAEEEAPSCPPKKPTAKAKAAKKEGPKGGN